MNVLIESNLCIYCGQSFKSINSLEFHKNICIYYQYTLMYTDDLSNNIIKQIVTIYNLLELYKLDSVTDINSNYDNVSLSKIINILYVKLHVCNLYSYLYNILCNIQGDSDISSLQLEFISYNELISIISKLLNVSTDTFCNVINTYNKCCNYFK